MKCQKMQYESSNHNYLTSLHGLTSTMLLGLLLSLIRSPTSFAARGGAWGNYAIQNRFTRNSSEIGEDEEIYLILIFGFSYWTRVVRSLERWARFLRLFPSLLAFRNGRFYAPRSHISLHTHLLHLPDHTDSHPLLQQASQMLVPVIPEANS